MYEAAAEAEAAAAAEAIKIEMVIEKRIDNYRWILRSRWRYRVDEEVNVDT